MELTINIDDKSFMELEKLRRYYKIGKELKGKEDEVSLEEYINSVIKIYLSWIRGKPQSVIKNDQWIINTHFKSIFAAQGRNQTDVSKLTGLSSSTLSNIWNGSVPSLENFLRLWIALGKPNIETLITIETTD